MVFYIAFLLLAFFITIILAKSYGMRTAQSMRKDFLFANMPLIATIFTIDFKPIYCSDTVVKAFKVADKEEYINDFFRFSPEFQADGISSREHIKRNVKHTLEAGSMWIDWLHCDSEGNHINMEVLFFTTYFQGEKVFVSYGKDITELKQTQQAAKVATMRAQMMFEIAPIMIEIWDKDLNLIESNPQALAGFGFKHPSEYWDKAKSVMPETQPCGTDSMEFWIGKLAQIRDEGRAHFPLVCLRPGGAKMYTDVVGARVEMGDESLLVTYTSDVTPMINSVEQMVASDENNRAKSRFLARMSHEIRTPLAAVLSISEIHLKRGNLQPAIEEAFSRIFKSGSDLLSIVNDILDLSRIEAGKLTITDEVYDVAELVHDVSRLNATQVDNRNLEFSVEVDENIPCHLVGDELRIKQVLHNVLTNAIKYTQEGSVSLSVSCNDLDDHRITEMVFKVQDTGVGMSKEQIDALYNEYVRFHNKNQSAGSGAGLGMPITIDLLKFMDGRIDVQSQVGIGTTVTIYLPQQVSGSEKLGPASAALLRNYRAGEWAVVKRNEYEPVPMRGKNVLIVDDLDVNLYIAKGLLEPYELDIKTCDNAICAINLIEGGETFDLILMDHMMPGIDGIKATLAMRKLGYTKPIVAVTANAIVGQSDMFLSSGFDGFLSKPIHTSNLHNVLMRFVYPDTAGGGIDLPSFDEINVPDLDEYLNQPEIAKQIIECFVLAAPTATNEIAQAISEEDMATAARVAHTIKSMACYLRNKALAETAETVELSLNAGIPPTNKDFEKMKTSIFECLREYELTP